MGLFGVDHKVASRFIHSALIVDATILNIIAIHCNNDRSWRTEDTYLAIAIAALHILYIVGVICNEKKVGSLEKKYRKAVHGIGGILLIVAGSLKWVFASDKSFAGSCTKSTMIAGGVLAITDGVFHILPTEYIFDQYL